MAPPTDSGLTLPFAGDFVGDPERRSADRELRDHGLVLLGAAHAIVLDGAERSDVELDRVATTAHRQLGLDSCDIDGILAASICGLWCDLISIGRRSGIE